MHRPGFNPQLRRQGQEGSAESEASLGYVIRQHLTENVWGCSVETKLEAPVVMCLLYPMHLQALQVLLVLLKSVDASSGSG